MAGDRRLGCVALPDCAMAADTYPHPRDFMRFSTVLGGCVSTKKLAGGAQQWI
jgi:hypothetical protein